MESQPVMVERSFPASCDQVWQAITDPEQMKEWYFDLPGFKAEAGYTFQFEGGPDAAHPYLHLCRVTEVIKEKKLSYSWQYQGYEGGTLVSFELFEAGNGTLLRLTHEGIETFPSDNPDLGRNNFVAGWNAIIGESLKNYFNKKAVPSTTR